MIKSSEESGGKSCDSLYVSGLVLIVLEVVFALNVVLRDALINNHNWANIFPIAMISIVELMIIITLAFVNYKKPRNIFALVPVVYIVARSLYGLLFSYGEIPMSVLRVSQALVCILIFARMFTGKYNKISG